MKKIRILLAKIRCKFDRGEWTKHYCTGNCGTCGYGKIGGN